MAPRTDIDYLREAIRISHQARRSGNHPFGALLVDADGGIALECGNTYRTEKSIGHAELNLARQAVLLFEPEVLETCTLVTSVEPCSMCAGGIYWAGIGTLVYGLAESRLAALTGDNPENPTMDLGCRKVLAAGRRNVRIRGPYPALEAEIIAAHDGFW